MGKNSLINVLLDILFREKDAGAFPEAHVGPTPAVDSKVNFGPEEEPHIKTPEELLRDKKQKIFEIPSVQETSNRFSDQQKSELDITKPELAQVPLSPEKKQEQRTQQIMQESQDRLKRFKQMQDQQKRQKFLSSKEEAYKNVGSKPEPQPKSEAVSPSKWNWEEPPPESQQESRKTKPGEIKGPIDPEKSKM